MSRSRKKTPIFGIAIAVSDKPFKVQEHRRERREAHQADADGIEGIDPRKFGNPWAAPKDGKRFWPNAKPKDMRK